MKMKKIVMMIGVCTAALALSACATKVAETEANTEHSVHVESGEGESSESAQEIVETKPVADEETKESPEGEETPMQQIHTTIATYHAGSEFETGDKLLFSNDEKGEFLCNISDMTELDIELEDGKEYRISHSPIMTMSLHGILPQVYSIRELSSEFEDTAAELKSIDEQAKTLLFVDETGYEFMTALPENTSFTVGDTYLITHDATMTRSLPGTYMNVTQIYNLSNE